MNTPVSRRTALRGLAGMAGGAFGALMGLIFPGEVGPVGAFAMVGMAAVVGAATGGPLTAIRLPDETIFQV